MRVSLLELGPEQAGQACVSAEVLESLSAEYDARRRKEQEALWASVEAIWRGHWRQRMEPHWRLSVAPPNRRASGDARSEDMCGFLSTQGAAAGRVCKEEHVCIEGAGDGRVREVLRRRKVRSADQDPSVCIADALYSHGSRRL